MTIKNLLRKPVLFSLGVLAAYSSGHAIAYNPRAQQEAKPSVEINLDVLDKLGASDSSAAGAGNAPASVAGEKSPFGAPTSAAKPMKKGEKSKKTAKKHHKKPKPKKAKKIPTAPEVKVIGNQPEQPESNNVPVVVPIPKEESKPAPLPEITKLPPSNPTVPALPPATTPAPAPTPPAPATKIEQLQPLTPADNKIQELPPTPPSPSAPAKPEASAPAPSPLPEIPVTPAAKPPAPAEAPKEIVPLPAVPSAQPTPPSAPSLPPVSGNPAPDLAKLPPLPGAELAPAPEKAPAPASSTKGGNMDTPDLRVAFDSNETDVPLSATGKLDGIAQQLIKNPDLRASIVAYAAGADAISVYPKRVSLARGISVRDYLTTARNIDVERVTVKALGNKSESGPPDRVDIYLIK